jgi:Icc-related predicted phosphoesterase
MKPKVHIFGHIHEGYGEVKIGDTHYYNASYVNLGYVPVNDPFLIEVKVKVNKKV